MQEIVVIDGEITLENVLDGEVELEAITDLDPEVVIGTGGAVYPHYTGSYTVTPSGSVQTLDTSDKVLDDDVTVQAVAQGSTTTPATIITADPTISVSNGGLITATVSKTQQITPTVQEGYVSAGTPGNVGVAGSNTQQLTVQSAQTIHPASTDQSIASGKYLTGNQTFKAVTVSGLTADKVLQGNVVKIGDADDDDRIMSVTGTASGGITPTGTKSITANGTGIDVYSYQYADVAVPNSYSAGDEGKVVSNGALVAQTSDTVTANDTYDTTLINSLTVNVSGGGVESATGEIVITSDISSPSSSSYNTFPGLQLSFQPDLFWVAMDHTTYDGMKTTVDSNHRYWMFGIRKSMFPVYRFSYSVNTDSSGYADYDMLFFANNTVTAGSDPSTGYGIGSILPVDVSRMKYWGFQNDGTLRYGRLSSTLQTGLYAGKYRYFAMKVPTV